MTVTDTAELLTPLETAGLLRCSRPQINVLLHSGALPARRVGGRWIIKAADLGPWLPPAGWDDALTLDQTAAVLGVGRYRVWQLIREHRLTTIALPAMPRIYRRIPAGDIDRYLAEKAA